MAHGIDALPEQELAEHLFPKAIRALAPWAPKAEAAILKARREAPKGGTR